MSSPHPARRPARDALASAFPAEGLAAEGEHRGSAEGITLVDVSLVGWRQSDLPDAVEIDEDEGRGISPNRQDAVAALADDGNGR